MKKTLIITILFAIFAAGIQAEEYKAYPNPFQPETTFLTISPVSGNFPAVGTTVRYTVYDYNRREITSGEVFNPTAGFEWNGRDGLGNVVSPGLYYIRLIVSDTVADTVRRETIKVLVK